MAMVILDPMIKEVHGLWGDRVYFTRNKKQYYRKYVRGRNPDTYMQRAFRGAFGDAVREWQALPAEKKERFNRRARNLNMSGYNLFISGYMGDNISNMKNRGKQADIMGIRDWNALHLLRFTSVPASLLLLYALRTACISAQERDGPQNLPC